MKESVPICRLLIVGSLISICVFIASTNRRIPHPQKPAAHSSSSTKQLKMNNKQQKKKRKEVYVLYIYYNMDTALKCLARLARTLIYHHGGRS